MKQLKLNMLLAVLMLCACTALSAASYEPFSQLTITDGIYQQGGNVTPNVNQEAAVFNDTYVPFENNGNTATDNRSTGNDDPSADGYGTGVIPEPLSGGYFFLIAMALGLAGLRVRKALCEE